MLITLFHIFIFRFDTSQIKRDLHCNEYIANYVTEWNDWALNSRDIHKASNKGV